MTGNEKNADRSGYAQPVPDTPVDVELLSQAIIELNILRKSTSLYPPTHSAIAHSVDRSFAALEKLHAFYPSLTIGVAKECLLVQNEALDPRNPIHKEFSLALYHHFIAAVTFHEGLQREEILDFIKFLTMSPEEIRSSGTSARVLENTGVTHIQIQEINYSDFHLTEEEEIKRETLQKEQRSNTDIWRDFVGNLVSGRLGGNGQGISHDGCGIAPSEIAEFLNHRKLDVRLALELYEEIMATRPGTILNQPLDKFILLLKDLRPELRNQFLQVTFDHLPERPEEPGEDLEAQLAVAMLQKANSDGREISPSLLALVETLSNIAEQETDLPVVHPPEISVEDMREASVRLFDRERYEDYVDSGYRQMLQELNARHSNIHDHVFRPAGLAAGQASVSPSLSSREKSARSDSEPRAFIGELSECFDESSVNSRIANLLLGFLDQEIKAEEYEKYCGKLIDRVLVLVGKGEFDFLVRVLGTLQVHAAEKPENVREIAEKYSRVLFTPEMISRLIDFLKNSCGKDFEKARSCLFALVDSGYPELLKLYVEDEAGTLNKAILDFLIEFGDGRFGQVYGYLTNPRPFVIRNTLDFIQAVGDLGAVPFIGKLLAHDEPMIRIDALSALLHLGAPEAVAAVRKALQSKTHEECLRAIELSGEYCIHDVVEDLLALVKIRPWHKWEYKITEAAIKSLGKIGDPRALGVLQKLAKTAWSLYPGCLASVKLVLFASLGGYPKDNLGEIIETGRRANDRIVRMIAERLSAHGSASDAPLC